MLERKTDGIDISYQLIGGINNAFRVEKTEIPIELEIAREEALDGTIMNLLADREPPYRYRGKLGEYVGFTDTATILFSQDRLDILTPIGKHAISAKKLIPQNTQQSIVAAALHAHDVISKTYQEELDDISVEVMGKPVGMLRKPVVNRIEHSLGGAREGVAVVGMAFASIIAANNDPQIAQIGFDRSQQIVTRMTTLNITPQKVVDTLIRYSVNPFTAHKTDIVPQALLRKDIFDYLTYIGEIFRKHATYETIDTNAVFKQFLMITPSSWFTLDGRNDESIKNEAAQRFTQFYQGYRAPEEMYTIDEMAQDPAGKMFCNAVDMIQILSSYVKFPEDRKTLSCPARHAQILIPWYRMWGNILPQWYQQQMMPDDAPLSTLP